MISPPASRIWWAIVERFLALVGARPTCLMYPRISGGEFGHFSGVFARANRAGVTSLTFLSVVCAESATATSGTGRCGRAGSAVSGRGQRGSPDPIIFGTTHPATLPFEVGPVTAAEGQVTVVLKTSATLRERYVRRRHDP